nr:MAG TPA: hypothetical protein [Siphoviridae sp. ctqA315]
MRERAARVVLGQNLKCFTIFVRNSDFCYFVTKFYHIPDSKRHLRPQRDDGAARAASCYIPPIIIAGMGFLFDFQRYDVFGRTFLVQKTSCLMGDSA